MNPKVFLWFIPVITPGANSLRSAGEDVPCEYSLLCEGL